MILSRFRIVGAVGAVGFLLPACVTRQDIRNIQTDLFTIQQSIEQRLGSVKDQTESVQTAQADLLQEIQALKGDLGALQTDLRDNQERMSRLAVRLDDLESSLNARMDAQIELLSGSKFVEKPLPSTLFNLASTDFSRGRYNEAITGFRSYLKQFPKGEKAPEAKLKIGDALAKQKSYAEAVAAYDDLISENPKDVLIPSALMRKAQAYEALGRKAEARETYSIVIKKHPYSGEARSAQDRMRILASDGK